MIKIFFIILFFFCWVLNLFKGLNFCDLGFIIIFLKLRLKLKLENYMFYLFNKIYINLFLNLIFKYL